MSNHLVFARTSRIVCNPLLSLKYLGIFQKRSGRYKKLFSGLLYSISRMSPLVCAPANWCPLGCLQGSPTSCSSLLLALALCPNRSSGKNSAAGLAGREKPEVKVAMQVGPHLEQTLGQTKELVTGCTELQGHLLLENRPRELGNKGSPHPGEVQSRAGLKAGQTALG